MAGAAFPSLSDQSLKPVPSMMCRDEGRSLPAGCAPGAGGVWNSAGGNGGGPGLYHGAAGAGAPAAVRGRDCQACLSYAFIFTALSQIDTCWIGRSDSCWPVPLSPHCLSQILCRQAVPLALALLNVSNPTIAVMDTLSRLSHDSDIDVAQNAILALGGCFRAQLSQRTQPILCYDDRKAHHQRHCCRSGCTDRCSSILGFTSNLLGSFAHDCLSPQSLGVLVVVNAIGLPNSGLVGAGTNNARLAGLLRSLSSYYYKEPTMLLLVRVAQGLVHLGKGLLSLSFLHTDRQLLAGAPLDVLSLCIDYRFLLT